ncbi:MAG: hypothetical protein P4K98_13455 [Bryobacteraceae bacterium]|nr:hypothetical protein [Bryobacteraceae bacterium]
MKMALLLCAVSAVAAASPSGVVGASTPPPAQTAAPVTPGSFAHVKPPLEPGKLGAIPLPPGVTAVKVEYGYALVHDGELSFLIFDLAPPFQQPRLIEIRAAELGVVSVRVQDFSLSPDHVLYISAVINFGLGDLRYALLRYALLDKDPELEIRHLPDVRCRNLGAGLHGVWCLDPEFREARNELPTLHWIAFLGAFKSIPIGRAPGISLGPSRVMVGPDDVAEAWLPSMRGFLEVNPQTQAAAFTPIPVEPSSRAITSFALSASGKVHALFPLRGAGEEMLTTPYALAELDAQRTTWRRVPQPRSFPRGALLAGWDGSDLWLWNRTARRLERIEGVQP